jgi:Type IV pili methyl-accepting chemotaxis transducer N-term
MFSSVSRSDFYLQIPENSRRLFVKTGFFLLASASLVHAQNAQAVNAVAVNRSARMRALSQRLVKLKAQQLLQINPDATSDSIVATDKLISSHLQFLTSTVPSSSRPKLDTLSRLATSLLAQAKVLPTVESLSQTNALSLEVLTAADELTIELQALAKVKEVEIINTAGRQRMLSQRMAKRYLLVAARVEMKDTASRMAADRKLFTDSMKQLSDSPLADAKVKQELANLASRYKKFDEIVADINEKSTSKTNQTSVATMSEQVLSSAHELTVLFEEALKLKDASA